MTQNILILYGSETGTAQDMAEQIWRDAKRAGADVRTMPMDDYEVKNLILERLVVFVVATAGQGDPPSNMRKFWRFLLRKNLPTNSLENLHYAVLGLGDSSYEKYNFAAKKLNRRLSQLGGREILPIGLADDQHDLGIDAVAGPWTNKLWNELMMRFGIPRKAAINDESGVMVKFNVEVIGSVDSEGSENEDIYRHESCTKDPGILVGKVLDNVRTSSVDHFQDVRLIKFEVKNVDYNSGDVVYIRPKNSRKRVCQFFDLLRDHGVNSLRRETIINVGKNSEIKVPDVLRQRLSLKQLAEQYWDLNYKPRRYTMEILSLITDSELEKEKLKEFTTPNGQEELYNYVNRPRRNIVEVLNDFPNATKNLNIQLLFEIMSPIKPRAFSIASSPKQTPDQIHVLIAVVEYKTKLLEPRLGLCSNWLASLKPGDETTLWIQKGTFSLDYSKPAVVIGPGTGVAPFRSFLFEKVNLNNDLSDCLLFFGCRNKLKDFHCRVEFESLVKNNKLTMFCAFSRDQEHKIYVQHKIREQGDICWRFVENGANIYLAGSSKNMPNNVRDEFVSMAKKFGKLTDDDAEEYVRKLEKTGRYQTETWS